MWCFVQIFLFLGVFFFFVYFGFFVPFILNLALWGRQGDSWNLETSPNSLCISISDLPPNHGQDRENPGFFVFVSLFVAVLGCWWFFWTVLRTSLFSYTSKFCEVEDGIEL